MPHIAKSINALADSLERHWKNYRSDGASDTFVEFTLTLNGLTERCGRRHLLGLARACQGLENSALALFGDSSTHPIAEDAAADIERQLAAILTEIRRRESQTAPARRHPEAIDHDDEVWDCSRRVLIVSGGLPAGIAPLSVQLRFFGFAPEHVAWHAEPVGEEPPLAVVFIPEREDCVYPPDTTARISALRKRYSTSFFYCLSTPSNLEFIVELQRAGADACLPVGHNFNDFMTRLLDLVDRRDQDVHRVLVVEDSATAVAHVRRSLSQHGIDSLAIRDPRGLLEAVADYRPDAVLMDMYMPFCNGVEATRALRQVPAYQALPVIYLSSETDIAQQVEALRLGGDQFLSKPSNPVVLASVIKTKINRYREMLHASRHDCLTGLLNHATAKAELEHLWHKASVDRPLAVAMIDIDRFKSINDNYGHPVGDQVIRGLAWLLRGRLRNSDLLGRYGGEEFLVALPGVGPDRARDLLDRVRIDFSSMPHAHARGSLHATFSCGIAAFPGHVSAAALIEAADDALLGAKRSGRNRVELAQPADGVSVVRMEMEEAADHRL